VTDIALPHPDLCFLERRALDRRSRKIIYGGFHSPPYVVPSTLEDLRDVISRRSSFFSAGVIE
jgi:hypothetical protein